MSSTANKRLLSESVNGKGIKVVATSTPGTLIHTAVAGTTVGTYDEVWLWAQNNHTVDVTLTVEYGSASTDDNITQLVLTVGGLTPVLPGLPLQNGLTIKAFASVTNKITLQGFINRITD